VNTVIPITHTHTHTYTHTHTHTHILREHILYVFIIIFNTISFLVFTVIKQQKNNKNV